VLVGVFGVCVCVWCVCVSVSVCFGVCVLVCVSVFGCLVYMKLKSEGFLNSISV
jgi:hypothetical protein